MSNRRVVVTGMGALTPIGNNVDEYWNALITGKNGAGYITRFDTTEFTTKFACELKGFNPEDYLDKKESKRMDPYTQYSMSTAKMAIEDSEIDLEKIDKERFGVIYGSGIGGMQTFETQTKNYLEGGPRKISPFFVPMMISDIAAGQISIRYGLKGPNYATTSACATSGSAITDAYMHIQRGTVDIMLCGGAEAAITPMAIGGFNAARALSTWNERYLEASRPYDKDRNGFVMGEGSGTLILEEYEHAIERGAKIYAELIGFGATGDAYHITAPAPNGEGAYRAMRLALQEGGIDFSEVEHINTHGTSTDLGDINETIAVKNVFGDHAYKISVNSTKSMTGHLLGAAGAVEAIATILALKNGIIPPTINLDEPDPACDLDYTPKIAKKRVIKYALNNTFGFGGHNSSLLFKKYEG